MQYPLDVIERFFTRIEPVGGCWLWTGGQAGGRAKEGAGYGLFWDGVKRIRAHRFSYLAFKGDIPDDLHVMHLCHNAPCVRPDHLRLGTARENLASHPFKARRKGLKYPELVDEISSRYAAGETLSLLIRDFGHLLGKSAIYRYATGRKYVS